MAVLLVNQSQPQEAIRTLQEMEPNLLGWIGQELYSTEGSIVRRQLVSSQSTFQDVVLTLATTEASSVARRLAGTVMLHWKQLQGDLARLNRRSQDPRVQTLGTEIGNLRNGLAAAARAGEPQAFEKALQALEAKQMALGQVSRDYKDDLRVGTANLDDLRVVDRDAPLGHYLLSSRARESDAAIVATKRTTKAGQPGWRAIAQTVSKRCL